jgi:hypothetical protein
LCNKINTLNYYLIFLGGRPFIENVSQNLILFSFFFKKSFPFFDYLINGHDFCKYHPNHRNGKKKKKKEEEKERKNATSLKFNFNSS